MGGPGGSGLSLSSLEDAGVLGSSGFAPPEPLAPSLRDDGSTYPPSNLSVELRASLPPPSAAWNV
ncbi:MAG TPA: hypothetical protein VFF67_03765 [Thermoplasmata archaeon]|nr:hypothetical protein [Thermoplasmata archaeon]